jgi:hypothetical protein
MPPVVYHRQILRHQTLQLYLTVQLQQGFVTGEMGLNGYLGGNNPQGRMSALGQKATSTSHRPMSALLLKADMADATRNVR